MSTEDIVSSLTDLYGTEVVAADIRAWCSMNGGNYQTITKKIESYKVGRGKWNLTYTEKLEKTYNAPAVVPTIEQNLIPQKDDTFVHFGPFNDIKTIIQANLFYPTFITGLSGNGKTFSVEQACAQLRRELIRVNITIETDEDDLIGGFRLVDGNTVWHNGPVIEALERGAVLLLDEVDLASNKILIRVAASIGVHDEDFCKRLVDWGDIIRKTFYDGGIDEIISTRRLVHILHAYSIFGDKLKAIQVCINRFDDETRQAFLELYDKVDATVQLPIAKEED